MLKIFTLDTKENNFFCKRYGKFTRPSIEKDTGRRPLRWLSSTDFHFELVCMYLCGWSNLNIFKSSIPQSDRIT